MANSRAIIAVGAIGVIAYLIYKGTQSVSSDYLDPSDSGNAAPDDALNNGVLDTLQTLGENAVSAIAGWKNVGQGPVYVPLLNAAEDKYGIPPDLLARIAYQESHFRQDIISGAKKSSAGAVGLMQLMPQYFPGAGQSPTADIATAAQLLVSLFNRFQDWQLAVAAYNYGGGNVNKYLNGTGTLPAETVNYVNGVFADVPVQGSLVAVA